ncbi:hypothetical protein V8C34DRAFT_287149 [Trichoderma compactum]
MQPRFTNSNRSRVVFNYYSAAAQALVTTQAEAIWAAWLARGQSARLGDGNPVACRVYFIFQFVCVLCVRACVRVLFCCFGPSRNNLKQMVITGILLALGVLGRALPPQARSAKYWMGGLVRFSLFYPRI